MSDNYCFSHVSIISVNINVPRQREAVVIMAGVQVIPWRLKDSVRKEPVHVVRVSPVENEIENLQAVTKQAHTNLH